MNSENLKTFLLLSKLRNFTQTAEELCVAQSTVTNRIAELERELGKPLFTREKKHVDLTKEGSMFVHYAKRMVELEEASIHELNASAQYENILHVGSTNTIYELGVYPMLHSFMLRHPSTAVKLTIAHSVDMAHLLQDHVLDVVFSYVPFLRYGYESVPLFADQLYLVTSPENTTFRQGICRKQLTELRFLLVDFALKDRGTTVRGLFPPFYPFPFETDSSTKTVDYLLDGMGYSFLPGNLVNEYLIDGRLISIPLLDFEAPVIQSYCSYVAENKLAKELLDQGRA